MPHDLPMALLDAGLALKSAKECGHTMSAIRHFNEGRPLADAPRNCGISDMMLAGLVLSALVHASDASAAEKASVSDEGLAPEVRESRQLPPTDAGTLRLPGTFEALGVPDTKRFSATEFRPRGHTIFDIEPITHGADEDPMLHSTTIWQRLAEYRSQDRVRVLTLWQSGAGTVSIQAGKGGSPSLQWTSRLMNRGEATHGLLDRVFALSLAGAGNALHGAVRSASVPAAGKQANISLPGSTMGNSLSASARDH
jgi:hypothetical protein